MTRVIERHRPSKRQRRIGFEACPQIGEDDPGDVGYAHGRNIVHINPSQIFELPAVADIRGTNTCLVREKGEKVGVETGAEIPEG